MTNRRYEVTGGLSQNDLETIYKDVLQVLEKIGIGLDNDEILEFLGKKPGIKIQNKRILYSRNLVEEFIPRIKKENLEYYYNRRQAGNFTMVPPFMAQNYVDMDTGKTRPMTREDCINSVKLCDSYDMYGTSPGFIRTVPEYLQGIATEKICIENSRNIGGYSVTENIRQIEFMCMMGEAAERRPPYCSLEIPISPLRLNSSCMEIIYRNRNHGHNLKGLSVGGGAIPMAGATAPIFFPAALVQGMAEALAAYITPQLIDPDLYGYCSFGGFIFDMKTMQPGYFFPESVLYNMAVRQVIRHVLGETMGVSFDVNFNNPKEMLGKLLSVGLEVCQGAKTFINVGAGSAKAKSDAFDPLKLVMMADVIRHLEKLSKGVNYNDDKDVSLKVIREAITDGIYGNYLDHPSTLQYREIITEPELYFKYSGDELIQKAREQAKERISKHDFRLSPDKLKEIEGIYREAEKALGKEH